MGPAILSVIENYVMYDRDLTDLKNRHPSVPSNETATFRSSMFGGKTLYFIDGIFIIWGAFLSTCALLTYLLANRAICRQYDYFNQKLRKHCENGSIKNLSTMKSFETQFIDLLQTATFITNNSVVLLNVTFICGLYIHITSQFALRAFLNSFQFIQLSLFGLWFAQSMMLLVLSLGRPSALRSLMKETNEVLLLEQRIWNDDPAIREIAFNISYKIQTIDYASKGMTPIKAGSICYTLQILNMYQVTNNKRFFVTQMSA
uniref:Gustatory receptor n=2 Tax=Panagrolaimus sp. PS1159 TaxID=55785 RepID=A0AC35FD38_9BILA